MDELDLVRLARPEAPAPDLAALRAAALGDLLAPPACDGAPAAMDLGTEPGATPAVGPPRPHKRLALAGLAAAALLVVGLAVAVRRGGGGGASGAALRTAVAGAWATLAEGPSLPGTVTWGPIEVSFQAEPGGALVVNGPCGTYVSRGYRLRGDRLELTEPLTSPEAGCADPAIGAAVRAVIDLLSSGPTLSVDGDHLDIGGRTFLRRGDLLARLDGRAFRLTSRTDGNTVVTPRLPVTLRFAGTDVGTFLGCNFGGGHGVVDGDRLQVRDFVQTAAACDEPLATDLSALLRSTVAVELDGDTLRLLDGTRTYSFTEIPVAQAIPAAAPAGTTIPTPTTTPPAVTLERLAGTTFAVESYEDPSGTRPLTAPLAFDAGNAVRFGCEGRTASARLGPDGTLSLGEVFIPKVFCPEHADADTLQALLTGAPFLTWDGTTLVLKHDDVSAVLRPRAAPSTPATSPVTRPDGVTLAPTTAVAVTPTLADLRGRNFVAGNGALLRFGDTGVSAGFGCNGGALDVRIAGGRFVVDGMESTLMGCTGDAGATETFVVAVLRSSPVITLTGDRLRLAGDAGVLDYVERLAAPLVGTVWTTNGRVTPQATGFAGYRATLRLDPSGTWALSGCGGNERRGRYALDGTAVTFTVADVGTGAACGSEPEADEARALAQLLAAGRLAFSVDDQSMRLTGPDGSGEMFVAAR